MFRLWSPFFILKMFCLYHAYKNNAEAWWYLVILFIPILGPLFYLYKAFYSRKNVDNAADSFQNFFNNNHSLSKLEKEVKYSDTVDNKTKLANAYISAKRYQDAISIYESCMIGYNADDPDLIKGLLRANYLSENYAEVVSLGEKIKNEFYFNKTNENIAFAWALHYVGKTKKAEEQFEKMNIPFANYKHRIEYCQYLESTHQEVKAKELLTLLKDEIDHMGRNEQRMKRREYNQINELLSSYK